jgi:hypothetical protein
MMMIAEHDALNSDALATVFASLFEPAAARWPLLGPTALIGETAR